MKIEMVREDWDDERPDLIKSMIDDGQAVHYLSSTLRDGPNIECLLRMNPDFDLLARYLGEACRESNEVTDEEYDELLDALKMSMPDIHKNLMKRCRGWNISQYYKDEINWKKIEKLLPKSFEDRFSMHSMIDSTPEFEITKVLMIIELYLQSGMMMLSIINRSKKNGTEVQPSVNLFRRIILTNLVLESPGRMGVMIAYLFDTDDLADRCLSLLSNHYNQDLMVGYIGIKLLESD